ncbi:S41 family peptidase [Hymenobacter cellulosilyticus]|uniref:S41 family peptidase n=1 Tax=Hymenobacter cellulosilyticus TaxID=2932248 RepID=A0A8T9QD44_9BACT|nr:S41 family peptidase [Hymenobacter cellulosilyticus]UOQ74038.1 S41 family peptidase [Hymenobacter cellulosilyticus]
MKLLRTSLLAPLLLTFGLCLITSSGGSAPSLVAPEKDFETFWRTYKDHYAFFGLHQLDWDQVYAKFRPVVTARTTPAELEATLIEMVKPLEDGHITIARGDKFIYKGTSRRHSYKQEFKEVQQDYWQTAYQNLQAAGFEPVRGSGPTVGKYQTLYVAKSSQNLGYLRLTRCFAELSGVMGTTRQEKQDQQRLLGLFDAALRELSGCRVLILDLRGNGGGHSGKEMASRFALSRRLTHFTAERQPGGYEQFTPLQPYYLAPNPALTYQKPLLILTNDGTASSAEELALALYQQPNVTTIGDATAGMFSDMYQARLSGKISFTLSHQRYFTPDTTLLEGRGVPVKELVPYSRPDLAQHHDPVIARALALTR